MPADVRKLLTGKLMTLYKERPAYQRNDWLCWVKEAVRPETRKKRIASMVSDLRGGKVYMGMKWNKKV